MCELFKLECKWQADLVVVAEGEVAAYRQPRQPVASEVLAEEEVSANRQPRQPVAPEALALKKVTGLQERLT